MRIGGADPHDRPDIGLVSLFDKATPRSNPTHLDPDTARIVTPGHHSGNPPDHGRAKAGRCPSGER